MSIPQILSEFAHDKQVATVAVLLAADIVFGILAAFKTRTFDVTRLADFSFDDVVKKVLPWLAVFALAKLAPGNFVAGVNLSSISDGYFAVIVAQMSGSLLNSFQDLGFPIPTALAKIGIGRAAQWSSVLTPVDDQGDQKPKAA